MDTQKTLQWLHDVSEYALREARENGNPEIAARLGSHPATQHYFNNVHARTTITPEKWAQDYSTYMQQADALREAYEAEDKVEQHDDRISVIEQGLNELKAAVAKLLENAEKQLAPEIARNEKAKATKKALKQSNVKTAPATGEEPSIDLGVKTPEEQPDEEEADEEQAEPEGE